MSLQKIDGLKVHRTTSHSDADGAVRRGECNYQYTDLRETGVNPQ
jgi:hypothetical protein